MLSISSPTLLLDKEKCLDNMQRMKKKADRHGLILKPHVKTHQSADIGNWLKEMEVNAITVSSVRMAAYFADNGWRDITIAFPVNILEVDAINELASSVNLTILISDEEAVSVLDQKLNHSVTAYIEIDTGSHRTGFYSSQQSLIQEIAHKIHRSSQISLKGLYSHPGHSYGCSSEKEVLAVYNDAREKMLDIKHMLEPDLGPLQICLGDTPCCSIADDFDGVDEISPGNFVFYDLMQSGIGACSTDNIAVALASPVTAVYRDRQEIVVHGGAVHLSKELLKRDKPHYGLPVRLEADGWGSPLKGCYVKALSQEHGIIKCSESEISEINVGDVIGILPVHSCLTADLMMGYRTFDGESIDHIRTTEFSSRM